MNVLDLIEQDIAKLSVSKQIEELRISLKEYMVLLNKVMERKGNMSFDYYNGCVSSYEYFKFSKDVLTLIDVTNDKLVSVKFLSKSFGAEFKFYPKTDNLIYWTHNISDNEAGIVITGLVDTISNLVEELK